jgi:membrane fusion protein (multidrug efflux system)
LNLDFTKITSPVDGIAGLALAQIGDLVSPTSGLLTTVSALDPIKVYFNVSEQSYLTYWRDRINLGENQPNLQLELILSDGSIYPMKGKVFFANRQVDPNTGTLQIVGTFPNPDLLLRPGQYGRVRAQTQLKRGAIVVPQRCVAELQGSYQVVVVDEANKAHIRSVKVGPQLGADWIIEEGIKPGEHVIVEGLLKAKEGALVNPKPYAPPAKGDMEAGTNSAPAPGQTPAPAVEAAKANHN